MKLSFPITTLTVYAGVLAVRSDVAPDADAPPPIELNNTNTTSTRQTASILAQMCGVDLFGESVEDVTNYKIPNDPDWCGIMAVNRDDAVTWTDHDGGTCWKKKIIAYTGFGLGGRDWMSNPNPRAVTFVQLGNSRVPDKPFFVKRYDGFDMPGFDIGSVRRGNANECTNVCIQTTNCFAVSWTDYQGGTCWLKGRVNVPVPKQGVVSSIIARVAHAFGACPRL